MKRTYLPRPCVLCGTLFTVRRDSLTRFCSTECRRQGGITSGWKLSEEAKSHIREGALLRSQAPQERERLRSIIAVGRPKTYRRKPMIDRFWAKVTKSETCWLWTAATTKAGYGYLMNNERRVTTAHRLSWELHFGPIPDGLFVCHHCDNPPCVRPTHLFLGTVRDNAIDAANKGRLRSQKAKRARLAAEALR